MTSPVSHRRSRRKPMQRRSRSRTRPTGARTRPDRPKPHWCGPGHPGRRTRWRSCPARHPGRASRPPGAGCRRADPAARIVGEIQPAARRNGEGARVIAQHGLEVVRGRFVGRAVEIDDAVVGPPGIQATAAIRRLVVHHRAVIHMHPGHAAAIPRHVARHHAVLQPGATAPGTPRRRRRSTPDQLFTTRQYREVPSATPPPKVLA
jgi:hypothetical protein